MNRREMLAATAGVLFPSLLAHAQQSPWPARPVRLIVPWAPGGAADVIARTFAAKLTEHWGQQVVIENKPGGNTIVGAVEALRAAPDGYTLFMPIAATLTTNPFMYSRLQYEPLRDFTFITVIARVPLIVMASSVAPAKTLPEIIQLAKRSPDSVTIGSAVGSQLQAEQWMRDWGVKFRYVAYKSGADITKALLGGEVHLGLDAIPNNLPHIRAGKITGLAVNTEQRMPIVPDVPTMDELKLKHTEPQVWHGIVAPAGLPAELQRKINADLQAVIGSPDVNDRLKDLGLDLRPGIGPDEFGKLVRAESAVAGPLVKELGLKVD